MVLPAISDIRSSLELIKPFTRRTPVMTSSMLDTIFGCEMFFKCENFQKSGAFKFRGAINAILSMSGAEREMGF
jgi:threonine dehydratase